MHRPIPLLPALAAVTLFLCAGAARAQEGGGAGSAPGATPPRDLHVSAGAGGVAALDGFGPYADLRVTFRTGLLELGGFAQGGHQLGSRDFFGAGATGGVAWRAPFGLRLSASAAVGTHHFERFGYDADGLDPGTRGTTLFVGVRGGASWIFGRGPTHFELGVAVADEMDILRPTVMYKFRDYTWTRTMIREIGTTHVTISLLRLGATFDIQ
ncbi:hypothetical protein [Sorangium sp. So ce131]|uniref:hypothetical protein n=1 Tax=Sorangium sp. So ce131 TaxID=3133282 RepID=UPI003F62D2B9